MKNSFLTNILIDNSKVIILFIDPWEGGFIILYTSIKKERYQFKGVATFEI